MNVETLHTHTHAWNVCIIKQSNEAQTHGAVDGTINPVIMWTSQPPDLHLTERSWEILDQFVGQNCPLSSKHQMSEYVCPVEFRDLDNLRPGALKLLWRLLVGQHLTKTFHLFFLLLSSGHLGLQVGWELPFSHAQYNLNRPVQPNDLASTTKCYLQISKRLLWEGIYQWSQPLKHR